MKTHWLIALMITENDDDAKLTALQATRRALVIPKSDYSPHRSSTTPTCHPLCSINVSFATVHLLHSAARLFCSLFAFFVILLPDNCTPDYFFFSSFFFFHQKMVKLKWSLHPLKRIFDKFVNVAGFLFFFFYGRFSIYIRTRYLIL